MQLATFVCSYVAIHTIILGLRVYNEIFIGYEMPLRNKSVFCVQN